jgi:hypothetical protein
VAGRAEISAHTHAWHLSHGVVTSPRPSVGQDRCTRFCMLQHTQEKPCGVAQVLMALHYIALHCLSLADHNPTSASTPSVCICLTPTPPSFILTSSSRRPLVSDMSSTHSPPCPRHLSRRADFALHGCPLLWPNRVSVSDFDPVRMWACVRVCVSPEPKTVRHELFGTR